MPLPDEDLLDKHFPDDENGRNGARRVFGIIAIILTVVFVIGLGMFYFMTGSAPAPEELPVIAENNPPERMKPEDPGGMEIPHQDTTVYDRVAAQTPEGEPEKLLPAPEEPVTADAANTATNPVPAETPAEPVPEKLGTTAPETQTAEIPTSLEGLPAPAASPEGETVTPENPAAPDVKAETKETAPEKVTEEKGVEVAAQPKAAETATTDFRIQLGAVKTEELAKSEWARMVAKHGPALEGLEPHYSPVNLGDKGTYLRIQTNTLPREDAESRCTKLKANNQACLIVRAVQ
ncbi:MAG TPA: SPOR domain-containing protein [Alphaproteobacteria bacterium]|nr:SPOR domain-containing protein [Alphaproteobacteria bacterium]